MGILAGVVVPKARNAVTSVDDGVDATTGLNIVDVEEVMDGTVL